MTGGGGQALLAWSAGGGKPENRPYAPTAVHAWTTRFDTGVIGNGDPKPATRRRVS
jgi:hypothetical protein